MLFDIIFFACAALIIAILYKFIFTNKQKVKNEDDDIKKNDNIGQSQVQNNIDRRENMNINQRNVRNRFGRDINTRNVIAPELEETKENVNERDVENDDDEVEDSGNTGNKVENTKKQLQKQAKKQEKKERAEAMKAMIEQNKKKEEEKRKKQEEVDKQKEDLERKEEEIIKQLQEEQRKKEEEEYNKWKDMFTIEETGKDIDNMENEENLLQKFVEYIKLRKVVVLDDLAAEFKLKTQDVVNRIKGLETSKILNGVIDDRGKYIYITEQEFEDIANYIKRKGRVTRSDLLIECNKIIKLNPSDKDKEKIMQEESKLLKEIENDFQNLEEQLIKEKEQFIFANEPIKA